jgi:asparagine synthase (glutamine-hydrolysing)
LCGIAGFTHANGVVRSSHIQRATNALLHRGPDQQGVYESLDVSLGAVRLKIIDLQSGDQPMVSEDGTTVIAFNGEIYNHAEIREELMARGRRFVSRSDTEVVLQAFREWDVECFRRLRGMFACALWTECERRLVLARDRLGIKPLYFYVKSNDIYFGSEIKTILAHPGVERQIDLDGLNCFLSLNYVPAAHTLIQGIQKLPPGHYVEWKPHALRLDSYWKPIPVVRSSRWSLDEAKEELDHLLRASVREHLISDVPLGVWASGGLDSSTVVHYASEAARARLKTFSVTFRGRSFDESPWIADIARQYGTDHFEFDLNESVDLCGAIERLAYYSDEPCADAGALPVWFLSEMSRKHVTVALSGEGADELFGGYETYLADRYSSWLRPLPVGFRKAGLAAARRWPVSDEKIGFDYKLKRFFMGSLMSPEYAHIFWNGSFSEAEKVDLCLKPRKQALQAILDGAPAGNGLDRHLRFDLQYYLTDNILSKVDRMSMAHSLEVRPPFLDHRICEFALSLPTDFKIRGSRLKFILRALMNDKLPPGILRRRKTGLDIPTHAWFRGVLRPLLLDTLTERAVADTGLFRWEGVKAIIDNHLNRRGNWGYQLWGLMILLLWMRQWKIQGAPTRFHEDISREPVEVSTLT